MTLFIENKTEWDSPFELENITKSVAGAVLEMEHCPYEAQINILITDNSGIRELNEKYRRIDQPTDVLSFPNLLFEVPGEFYVEKGQEAACFDPDTGELLLGDIVVSVTQANAQADSYGHSLLREYAFLIAHSMLHLCGYDHMETAEAEVMEKKQEAILEKLKIIRA